MKTYLRILSLLLALVMFTALLGGCAKTEQPEETEQNDYIALHSSGIDNEGYWKDIKALDYVEGFDYDGLVIPADVYAVSDEEVQSTIDSLMKGYFSRVQIMDRAIAAGDTVNIDYTGKVDGEVYDGLSTMEVGVDAVVTPTSELAESDDSLEFLDSFLEQLIGHKPGETIEIKITFPSNYREEALANKEAVLETRINYILERHELTDEFVQEKLSSSGWTSVADMQSEIRDNLQESHIEEYIKEYLMEKVPVKSIPESLIEYQQNILLNTYQEYADYLGITLDQYLIDYESGATLDEFLASIRKNLEAEATYSLVAQAVAESANITVTDADMDAYSENHLWGSDLSVQIDCYGLPYVKQTVLYQMVVDLILEHVVLG